MTHDARNISLNLAAITTLGIAALLTSPSSPSLVSAAAPATTAATSSIVWATGDVDETGVPQGKLLSDNLGYWGPSVLTGVDYTYESNPDNPRDRIANQPDTFGRRLLDGKIAGNWHVPVGQSRGPMVVVFDFKRPCSFNEVTVIATRLSASAVKIEVRNTPDEPWRETHAQSLETAPPTKLNRVKLDTPAQGRYMRLSITSKGVTYIDEILVWGQGEVSDAYPENISPTYHLPRLDGQWESIPGIAQTRFDKPAFDTWRRTLGNRAQQPAVWAAAEHPSPQAPIFPTAAQMNAAAAVHIARNETESSYVTLTNTSLDQPRTLTISDVTWKRKGSPSPDDTIQTQWRIGGALPSTPPKTRLTAEQTLRLHVMDQDAAELAPTDQVQVIPFFAADEMLGSNMMARYLTNSSAIQSFPRITLPPGGSVVLMLRTTTSLAQPGVYEGTLLATTDDGQRAQTTVTAHVANVTLPDLPLWIRSWGVGTDQFPFETQARLDRDALVNRQLGVTVWEGMPTPGSKAERFGRLGHTTYRIQGIPAKYVHLGYTNRLQVENLTDEDRTAIRQHAQSLVAQAKALDLDYSQWWAELWDEPQERNVALFGELAKIIHETDPNIRIYMNPLFWRPGHAPPEKVHEDLAPYYNKLISVSVPISTLVRDENAPSTALWTHKRPVNAMFIHPATRAGRAFSWRAFSLGFNGWGYYCYYAPRGNAWDIRTWTQLGYNYQMVFPGYESPVPAPIYETMRDGWEDYRLFEAYRQKNPNAPQLIAQALKEKQPLQDVRNRILESFK